MSLCRWDQHNWSAWLVGRRTDGLMARTCTRCPAIQTTRAKDRP